MIQGPDGFQAVAVAGVAGGLHGWVIGVDFSGGVGWGAEIGEGQGSGTSAHLSWRADDPDRCEHSHLVSPPQPRGHGFSPSATF